MWNLEKWSGRICLQSNRDADIENGPVDTGGRRWGELGNGN